MSRTPEPEIVDAYLGVNKYEWLPPGKTPEWVAENLVSELGAADGYSAGETREILLDAMEWALDTGEIGFGEPQFVYSFDLSGFERGAFTAVRYSLKCAVSGDWVTAASSDAEALELARKAAVEEWTAPETREPTDFTVSFEVASGGNPREPEHSWVNDNADRLIALALACKTASEAAEKETQDKPELDSSALEDEILDLLRAIPEDDPRFATIKRIIWESEHEYSVHFATGDYVFFRGEDTYREGVVVSADMDDIVVDWESGERETIEYEKLHKKAWQGSWKGFDWRGSEAQMNHDVKLTMSITDYDPETNRDINPRTVEISAHLYEVADYDDYGFEWRLRDVCATLDGTAISLEALHEHTQDTLWPNPRGYLIKQLNLDGEHALTTGLVQRRTQRLEIKEVTS